MRERIKEIIHRRIGQNPEAVRELIRRTVERDMQNSRDQAVETLMSNGTDYAIEILARVQEAHWIDALDREIDEALSTLQLSGL